MRFLCVGSFPPSFLIILCASNQIKPSSPLYTAFSEGTGGAPQKGETLTHADVERQAAWPTIAAILKKEYVEV